MDRPYSSRDFDLAPVHPQILEERRDRIHRRVDEALDAGMQRQAAVFGVHPY